MRDLSAHGGVRHVDIEKQGRYYRVEVPEDAPANTWQYGIIIGPPDLSGLGLPSKVEVRLHNELFNRGLITKIDLRKRLVEVEAALRSALRVDVQTIAALYEEGPKGQDGK